MKAVAVPYIIAILLGVGVIGLIGYWLFVSGGQFGGGVATTACRNAQLNYCNVWIGQGIGVANTAWSEASPGTGCTKPDSDNNICASYGVKIGSVGTSPATCDVRLKPPSDLACGTGKAYKCVNGNWVCG